MNIDADAILIHQVHPVKLAFDISSSLVSNLLLWQHRLGAGLAVRYVLPVIGSALVLRLADLDRLRGTARARYVLEHMPPSTTAIRLGGDTLMAVGAWRKKPSWMVAGGLLVVAGWSHGIVFSGNASFARSAEPISIDR